MPSPFPGMDPYVERPDLWVELHNPLMMYARDALQPQLPPQYVARLELRIYAEHDPNGGRTWPRVPDLEVVRIGSGGGAAVLPDVEEAESRRGFWVDWVPVERREVSLSIRTAPDGELVTWVELLSPGNKRQGDGREFYLRKQADLLAANVNLIEVDLLRSGLHTIAAPEEAVCARRPAHDYRLCVHRTARPWSLWVDAWSVRELLPSVPIPLGREEPELELNLTELFGRAYDNAAFRKLIDYGAEPKPPLAAEDAAWADALLRKAGLRGAESA